jgi:uncharacterized SAM-binding protein YcdF (DUF218 family)
MSRGLALFFGLFTLLNLAGDSAFDLNLWWIDLWPLPRIAATITLIAFSIAMLAFAFGRSNAITLALTIVMLIAAVANTIRFYVVFARGEIHSNFPVPLSLLIAVALGVLVSAWGQAPSPVRGSQIEMVLTFLAAALIFPLAQISLFGFTDYRRPADLIVVFGAKAYPNGTPSSPLADRVRTACDLYRDGLAPRLLFSGGPGEPESMRQYAMKRGVPASAIVEDPAGLNTEATVRNTVEMSHGRILAVSHFYHLPRIKMTFQRYGSEVYTVPSETTMYALMPYQLAREDAAFWAYYLRRFK